MVVDWHIRDYFDSLNIPVYASGASTLGVPFV
jgi:hypothetical protein